VEKLAIKDKEVEDAEERAKQADSFSKTEIKQELSSAIQKGDEFSNLCKP
jgi:hypothetical protein